MGHPVRILHAVVNMNRGGAETLIMNLYRNMDRTKVQFDFLTCKEGVFDSEIMEMGGKIHRIPYVSEVGHFQYVKELDRFFAAHRDYKIVHSHMDKMSGFVLWSAKKAGIPVRIAHSHSTGSEGGLAARTYKWYAGNHILPASTHFMACSREAASWLFRERADSAKILHNGIECERFAFSPEIRSEVRAELNIPDDELLVGNVGRFNRPKNHNFLIDVFAELKKTNSRSTLLLIGDGPLRPDIEKKARELQLIENVKFLGIRNDIHRLLQALDIFVFPSLHEGMPVTLIEAQGAGLPCIISDRVTKEVDMGLGTVDFVSLHHAPEEWVKKMLASTKRVSGASSAIKQNGYDIFEVSEQLQQFYLAGE